jgi:hypothetical protein
MELRLTTSHALCFTELTDPRLVEVFALESKENQLALSLAKCCSLYAICSETKTGSVT